LHIYVCFCVSYNRFVLYNFHVPTQIHLNIVSNSINQAAMFFSIVSFCIYCPHFWTIFARFPFRLPKSGILLLYISSNWRGAFVQAIALFIELNSKYLISSTAPLIWNSQLMLKDRQCCNFENNDSLLGLLREIAMEHVLMKILCVYLYPKKVCLFTFTKTTLFCSIWLLADCKHAVPMFQVIVAVWVLSEFGSHCDYLTFIYGGNESFST
jgi:hypothetical protein